MPTRPREPSRVSAEGGAAEGRRRALVRLEPRRDAAARADAADVCASRTVVVRAEVHAPERLAGVAAEIAVAAADGPSAARPRSALAARFPAHAAVVGVLREVCASGRAAGRPAGARRRPVAHAGARASTRGRRARVARSAIGHASSRAAVVGAAQRTARVMQTRAERCRALGDASADTRRERVARGVQRAGAAVRDLLGVAAVVGARELAAVLSEAVAECDVAFGDAHRRVADVGDRLAAELRRRARAATRDGSGRAAVVGGRDAPAVFAQPRALLRLGLLLAAANVRRSRAATALRGRTDAARRDRAAHPALIDGDDSLAVFPRGGAQLRVRLPHARRQRGVAGVASVEPRARIEGARVACVGGIGGIGGRPVVRGIRSHRCVPAVDRRISAVVVNTRIVGDGRVASRVFDNLEITEEETASRQRRRCGGDANGKGNANQASRTTKGHRWSTPENRATFYPAGRDRRFQFPVFRRMGFFRVDVEAKR